MCSPFWVSFFREINWQSAKIYQHIARLSDKLKQWGNQLWPCRCVQASSAPPTHPTPPTPPSPLPTTPKSLGKAGWVRSSALIYLFESLIHQPLQMTLAADDHWIPSPRPPPSSPLPQTRLVLCEEGVINIKNTQIREEQWIPLEAGEGELRY